MRPPKSKTDPPKETRVLMELRCSKCHRVIVVQAYRDPTRDDGWPKHRCGFKVAPFDSGEPHTPTKIAPMKMMMPTARMSVKRVVTL